MLEGVKGKLTKATALAIMGRFPESIHFCSQLLCSGRSAMCVLLNVAPKFFQCSAVVLVESVEHPRACCIL